MWKKMKTEVQQNSHNSNDDNHLELPQIDISWIDQMS